MQLQHDDANELFEFQILADPYSCDGILRFGYWKSSAVTITEHVWPLTWIVVPDTEKLRVAIIWASLFRKHPPHQSRASQQSHYITCIFAADGWSGLNVPNHIFSSSILEERFCFAFSFPANTLRLPTVAKWEPRYVRTTTSKFAISILWPQSGHIQNQMMLKAFPVYCYVLHREAWFSGMARLRMSQLACFGFW